MLHCLLNEAVEDSSMDSIAYKFNFDDDKPVKCIFCDVCFQSFDEDQVILNHFIVNHKFLIGGTEKIADLRQYILYWSKLNLEDLDKYCIVYMTNSEPGAKHMSELYYLLCDKLEEDRKLRDALRQAKLNFVVTQKERELSDYTFSRKCIYCRNIINGGLHAIFTHLTYDHGFNLGNPDNIVFGAKLLDVMEQKLMSLQCLECEKTFKNHVVLREHMRKKVHRSLNPKNSIYDQFYILNYIQPGVPWEKAKLDAESPRNESLPEDSSALSQWTDWNTEQSPLVRCLFCDFESDDIPFGAYKHMDQAHHFYFEDITKEMNFYQKVKLINYVRHQISKLCCICCSEQVSSSDDLLSHMRLQLHFQLPDSKTWNSQRYLLPVIEEDSLIYSLHDNEVSDVCESSWSRSSDEAILPEEIGLGALTGSILEDPRVRHEISSPEDNCLQSSVICLFCNFTSSDVNCHHCVCRHMAEFHGFNFFEVVKNLPFYDRVKLVNFIRWNTFLSTCYYCDQRFLSKHALEEHRTIMSHCSLPEKNLFKKPKWLLPFLDNDGFLERLCGDFSENDSSSDSENTPVMGEEVVILPSVLQNGTLRRVVRSDSVRCRI